MKTTIEISDLFYNVPARRKYLKQASTEFDHVQRVVTGYALANPDVAVTLEHDGRERFATTGSGDLREAVLAVYGKEVARAMVALGDGEGGNGVARRGVDREPYLTRVLEAADRMDGQALREELMRAVVKLSAPVFVTEVVGPLLHRVGDLWERGELRPAQEHVVSTAVRQVLDWLLARYEAPPSAPLMVVGTPSGEQHEFGAMLAAVVAADAGWRVLYLGPSLPPEEIALAAERAGAAVVAVSLVDGAEEEPEAGYDVLTDLRASVPAGVLVVAGGRRAARVPDGVTRVEDLEGLRSVLAAAGPPEGGGR